MRAAAGRGIAITSGDSATTIPLGWTRLAAAGVARATSTHSGESGIQAFTAGCGFPAAPWARSAATVAAGTVCTATAAQRPSTWRCWLLKYVASRWIAGAISPETATCAVVVWPVQVARAEMVLAPSATRRVAAIAAASRVNSAVPSLRLRPGRYRPAGAGACSCHEIPHITSRAARAASPCGHARRPHRIGQTRERCGHDCSGRSSPVRSLDLYARDVPNVRKPVLPEGAPCGCPAARPDWDHGRHRRRGRPR